MEKCYLVFSSVLFLFSMVTETYSATPFGLHFPQWFDWVDWEKGPFLSALFVGLGWSLSRRINPPGKRMIAGLIFGGFLLQLLEGAFLWRSYGTLPTRTTFGTIPFSLGIFLWALSRPQMGDKTFWPHISKVTLGVYVAHIIFLDALYPFKPWVNAVLWHIMYPFLVYLLTYLFVSFLARFRLTKNFVC